MRQQQKRHGFDAVPFCVIDAAQMPLRLGASNLTGMRREVFSVEGGQIAAMGFD